MTVFLHYCHINPIWICRFCRIHAICTVLLQFSLCTTVIFKYNLQLHFFHRYVYNGFCTSVLHDSNTHITSLNSSLDKCCYFYIQNVASLYKCGRSGLHQHFISMHVLMSPSHWHNIALTSHLIYI